MKRSVLAGEKGAAAVEFALVFLPLIILIFGAIEFGLVMYNKQIITNASREGARAGIVKRNPVVDDEVVREVVRQYSLNHLISFGSDSKKEPETDVDHKNGQTFGNDLAVTVTYQYRFLTPWFGGPLQLSAQTVMRYE